jgi:hypothetical protein
MPKKTKKEKCDKCGMNFFVGLVLGLIIMFIIVAVTAKPIIKDSITECPEGIRIPTWEEGNEFCKARGFDHGGTDSISCSGGIQCYVKLTEDTTRRRCFTAEEVYK